VPHAEHYIPTVPTLLHAAGTIHAAGARPKKRAAAVATCAVALACVWFGIFFVNAPAGCISLCCWFCERAPAVGACFAHILLPALPALPSIAFCLMARWICVLPPIAFAAFRRIGAVHITRRAHSSRAHVRVAKTLFAVASPCCILALPLRMEADMFSHLFVSVSVHQQTCWTLATGATPATTCC